MQAREPATTHCASWAAPLRHASTRKHALVPAAPAPLCAPHRLHAAGQRPPCRPQRPPPPPRPPPTHQERRVRLLHVHLDDLLVDVLVVVLVHQAHEAVLAAPLSIHLRVVHGRTQGEGTHTGAGIGCRVCVWRECVCVEGVRGPGGGQGGSKAARLCRPGRRLAAAEHRQQRASLRALTAAACVGRSRRFLRSSARWGLGCLCKRSAEAGGRARLWPAAAAPALLLQARVVVLESSIVAALALRAVR